MLGNQKITVPGGFLSKHLHCSGQTRFFIYLAFPEMATVQGVIDASSSYNSNNVNKISFWNMHYYLCKINTATFPLQIILSVKKKKINNLQILQGL